MGLNEKLTRIRPLLLFSLKVNGAILAIDLLILALILLLYGKDVENLNPVNFIDSLLFLETGLMLFIGGATEMTSTTSFSKIRENILRSKENWTIDTYTKGRHKALQYIFIGTLLAVESMLLALAISL